MFFFLKAAAAFTTSLPPKIHIKLIKLMKLILFSTIAHLHIVFRKQSVHTILGTNRQLIVATMQLDYPVIVALVGATD